MQLLTQSLSKPQSVIQSFISFRFFTQHLKYHQKYINDTIELLCEPPGSQQGRRIDVDRMDEHSSHIHQDIQHDTDNLNLKVEPKNLKREAKLKHHFDTLHLKKSFRQKVHFLAQKMPILIIASLGEMRHLPHAPFSQVRNVENI